MWRGNLLSVQQDVSEQWQFLKSFFFFPNIVRCRYLSFSIENKCTSRHGVSGGLLYSSSGCNWLILTTVVIYKLIAALGRVALSYNICHVEFDKGWHHNEHRLKITWGNFKPHKERKTKYCWEWVILQHRPCFPQHQTKTLLYYLLILNAPTFS